MGHCEYTTDGNVPMDGIDKGAEFGFTTDPMPPPQMALMPYRPTMLASLQAGPIVITHVHLRMYPSMAQPLARPGWGAGMSVNIDRDLNWYRAGGNVNNQSVEIPDDNSADLGALLYDPNNGTMQAYFDWSGHPPVLTINDGLVLSVVNFGGGATGTFKPIWDFDYLPLCEWTGPSS